MRAVNVLYSAVIALITMTLCPTFALAQHGCGASSATHEERRFITEHVANLPLSRNANTVAIPVNAIVVRQDNSEGGLSLIELNYTLSVLNYYYQSAGVEFYYSRHPYYINNTDLYNYDERDTDTNGGDSDNQYGIFGGEVNNAINIYFVNTITRQNGLRVAGFAYYPSPLQKSNRLFITSNSIINNKTIPHELGHYFGLMHTHESTENGSSDEYAERVERNGTHFNADVAGDMIADTDADPRYKPSEFDALICSYNGLNKDKFGMAFVPPVSNIMSYFPASCGMDFTKGQYNRIAQGVNTRTNQTAYTLDAAPMAVKTPTQLIARFDSLRNAIKLTWKDNANNEIGYIIERSLNPTSGFRPIIGAVTIYNETAWEDKAIQNNTAYYYRIKATNGGINEYSNVATVRTNIFYCLPNKGTENATITQLQIKSGTNILLENQGYNNVSYSNFCDKLVSLTADKTYRISAIFNKNQYFGVWADLNKDGEFDEVTERLYTNTTATRQISGDFKLPNNVALGAVRLRVRCANSWVQVSACGFDNDSQTHDYTMVVKAAVADVVTLKAAQEGNQIMLNWGNAKVVNSDYFILEYSKNGETYEPLANIVAVVGENHFEHIAPNFGSNYYRLTKANGVTTNKTVLATTMLELQTNDDVSLAPNPASSDTKLSFVAPKDGQAYIDVFDGEGSLMQHHFVKSVEGTNAFMLHVGELETGVYFVRITQEGKQQQTISLMKQ